MPAAPGHAEREVDIAGLGLVQVLDALGHAVVVTANRDDMPIVYVNRAFEAITGRTRQELLGRNCRMLQGDLAEHAPRRSFREAIAGEAQATVLVRNVRPDGSRFWNEVVLSPIWTGDECTHYVGVQSDVTARIEAQEQVQRLADRDALTGLSNRRHLQAWLRDPVRSGGRSPAVLFIDVDGFKSVNDALGHEAGDELLRQLADRLTAVTRPTDLLARVGGDEFVVALAPPIDARDATLAAERVLEATRRPFALGDLPCSVRVSIGVADDEVDGRDVLEVADAAMYRAKRGGGDAWVLASPPGRQA